MTELVPSRPVQVEPGFMIHNKPMAWRPYENLIDGELDNRIPGKVTGWMRFYRANQKPLQVTFDLAGDFHEDIRGKVIRLNNDNPSDRGETLDDSGKTYMEGFASVQMGEVGDMTAGRSLGPWTKEIAARMMTLYERSWEQANLALAERDAMRRELSDDFRKRIEAKEPYYPYVEYPYLEWFSEKNGRVVLELDDSQVTVVDGGIPTREKTPGELLEDERKRAQAMVQFLGKAANEFAEQNRETGDDSGVTSVLVS